MTLVLDFQPNAVHAGIYAALADGADLDVKVPGASTDAPKLLQAGRADLAVMDIQDLAIARERGADLVAVGALVQRPLAAVIAGDRAATRTPADLRGATVGVTGLPSDDAVLAAVLDSAGGDRGDPPETVTIGFDAISALSAGRVDAATAFWNVEGVALREAGVPTREFRVDDYGAPKFPELVLVTTRERLDADRERIASVVGELRDGYQRVIDDPEAALADELDAVPGLDEETLAAQLDALGGAFDRLWPSTAARSSGGPTTSSTTGSSSSAPTSTRPSTSTWLTGRAEQPLGELRQLARHPRARDDEVEPGLLRAAGRVSTSTCGRSRASAARSRPTPPGRRPPRGRRRSGRHPRRRRPARRGP